VDGAAATMRVLSSGSTEITLPRLSDGLYSVIATVEDLAGNASAPSAPLAFTIDTTAPSTPTLGFAAGFDTAPVGDGITSFERVTLSGHTDPLTAVALYRSYDLQTPIARGTSGASGDFSFADVALSTAGSGFRVVATDAAGNAIAADATFTTTSADTTGPRVSARLANDTGPDAPDGMTSAPTGAGGGGEARARTPLRGRARGSGRG